MKDNNVSTYDEVFLKNINEIENDHFWFLSRRAKIDDFFSKFINKNDLILEIGSGTCFNAESLLKLGYNIELSDVAQNFIEFGRSKGFKTLYKSCLFDMSFNSHYDSVCCFDVLEHFESDVLALKKIKSILKPKGTLIFTVPAHNWLWSSHDLIAGHKKRYNQASLSSLLNNSGFEIISSEYFFSYITPLLLLRTVKFILKKDETCADFSINPILNKLLKHLCRFELKLNPFSKMFGGSIICIAKSSD